MKKRLFIFSFLIIFSITYSFGQEKQASICYWLSVAEYYFLAKKDSLALDAFQKAYNSGCSLYPDDYFNAAKSATAIDNLLAVEFFLEKSLTHGINYQDYVSDSVFTKLPQQLKNKIESQFPEFEAAHYLSLDVSAVEKISELIAVDQMIRQRDSEAYLGIQDLTENEKYKVWCSVDSVFIFKNLLLFFDEYSNLQPSDVGQKRKDLVLMLKHQSYYADKFEKLLPSMERAVNSGLLKASELAMLTDSYLIRKNGTQKYGTGWRFNDEDKMELYPLESVGNLDLLRQKVGLIPLGLTATAQMSDSILPQKYILSSTIEDFCQQ